MSIFWRIERNYVTLQRQYKFTYLIFVFMETKTTKKSKKAGKKSSYEMDPNGRLAEIRAVAKKYGFIVINDIKAVLK